MNWLFVTAHSFAYWLENKAELLHDWAYRHHPSTDSFEYIVATTIRNRHNKMHANLLKNNALLERLKSKKADQ